MPNFKMIGPVVSEIIRDKHTNTYTYIHQIYIYIDYSNLT